MSKKLFTDEEVAVLAANPYTYRVTSGQISFTKEFKELFWTDYQQRMSPTQIFRKYGYDPGMVGRSRITGLQQSLKREVESGLVFHEGPRRSGERRRLTSGEGSPSPDTIREMQHKIEYLEQEVEFLKKIFSTRNTRK